MAANADKWFNYNCLCSAFQNIIEQGMNHKHVHTKTVYSRYDEITVFALMYTVIVELPKLAHIYRRIQK